MDNMIIEDERGEGLHDQGWQRELVEPHGAATFEESLYMHQEIRDRATHDCYRRI
jgi:hypothetical protein